MNGLCTYHQITPTMTLEIQTWNIQSLDFVDTCGTNLSTLLSRSSLLFQALFCAGLFNVLTHLHYSPTTQSTVNQSVNVIEVYHEENLSKEGLPPQ